MAHYDITYTCGHTDRVNLIGPHRSRAARINYMESGPCFECYKVEKHQAAREQAQEMDLPLLDGTPKQVEWAESLRVQILAKIDAELVAIEAKTPPDHVPTADDRAVLHAVAVITTETSARWWIDHRDDSPAQIIREVAQRERRKPTPAQQEKARVAKVQQEKDAALVLAAATIRPEQPITETVAEIRIVGNTVTIHFPEKRDDFREIVKGLGYTWDNGRWARTIGTFNGPHADRAAEAGHTLLSNGFCIRILDDALRAAAVAGEYTPECTRWIRQVITGEHKGWFEIVWSRDEDFYAAARRITASRYERPFVVVPPEQFEQVLDFATRYDFHLSQGAQQVLERARAARGAMLTTQPAPKRKPRETVAPVGDTPPVLTVPETVEIADSLKDD